MICRLAPLAVASLLALTLAASADDSISVVTSPPAEGVSPFYPSNRPPLHAAPLVKLPVGQVHPDGWLRKQLELQANGFHGHLTQISTFLKKDGNSWLAKDGQGQRGWEEVPYWLKGFGDCAYLLGRDDQIQEAKTWIEGALASQAADGFFGPRGKGAASTVGSTEGKYDLWPNMVMLNCLQSYYEYTGDRRVIDLMTKYFKWQLALPEAEFLPPYWQQQRGADNLASVYWLYNRTGEPWLLDLAAKTHRRTANYTDGVPNWHNVNVAQAFGGPVTYWQQSGEAKHREAADRNYRIIRESYGQVPGALFGADENARPGYTDPRQAVETCGMAEFMLSTERLLGITGDAAWADRCEDAAFNMLPAALTADFKGLRYLTAPNMATADRRSHSPGIQNGGPMFFFDPNDHRCCQHNFGHAWPYLAENLIQATLDRGAAVAFPIAGSARLKVGPGDGSDVTLSTTSHYPFDGPVTVSVQTAAPVAFPLYIRVPGWCPRVDLAINGQPQPVDSKPDSFLKIERTWAQGDTVTFTYAMPITLRVWKANHNSVSVDRGPLTYSLEIGEAATHVGGTPEWPGTELQPSTPWNVALVLNHPNDPAANFQVLERPWPASDMPFTHEGTPIVLEAQGRLVPEWTLDSFGLVTPLQDSPVKTGSPVQTIRLIPMGAARLRISAFPVAGDGPDAVRWSNPPKLPHNPTASHTHESDTLAALSDGILPANSNDQGIPRHTFWPIRGGTEYVQYDFEAPREVSQVRVYWFDDTQTGGGCAVPASFRLLSKSPTSGEWTPVPGASTDHASRDTMQSITFPAVTVSALRLEVKIQPDRSAGILEWEID
jgi:DUF1680 family protein